MENRRRIILATVELEETAKSRLVSSLESGWELKMEEEISENDWGQVEILLLGFRSYWLTPERLHPMKNLRLIQTFSAGVDHIDFGVIPPEVTICSNAGAYGGPISEFVLGAVIALARDLYSHDKVIREGKFVQAPLERYMNGTTVGIIGTGGIGQDVARLAKAFGMKTIGINTSGKPVSNFDRVLGSDGLPSLLRESDVIVVAVPLTVKTKNLLGRNEFRLVKPDCIIVNVARGAIINEEALYEFLRDHPQAKAALDVWWRYPKSGDDTFHQDYPISSLPNVLSSPHFSDGVKENVKLGSENAIENVIRYLRKEPLKGVVNREDYIGLRHGS